MKKFALAAIFLLAFAVAILADQTLPAPSATYPQIDIQGFKKWEFKNVNVDPARNYLTGLTQLGGYYPTFTGGPWQERLQLKIIGQLSKDLSVSYDLNQEPEAPEKFDVNVKYFNNELTFGDLTANFTGNEFVSASKTLNGVMFSAKENWYDVLLVPSAKLKSQTQALTSQNGNNARGPYNLGHGSIVEGSESIKLNNIQLIKNIDYTIDYFEGKITFNRILSQTDVFQYSYEYTNILDQFFPTLSNRDFFGLQSRFTIDPDLFGKPAPKEEPVIGSMRETFPTQSSGEAGILEEEATGLYRLRNTPIISFSEKLTFMGTELKKNEDYLIRYDSGEIKLLTRFLPSADENLLIEYRYYQTSQETEVIPGIGSRGPYHTFHMNLVKESERLEVDGKLFIRDLDYKIKYDTGELMFGVVIGPTSQIKIAYRYNVVALPALAKPKYPKELKLGATYLKETAKASAGVPTATIIESFSGQTLIGNNFLLNLKNRPVATGESLVVRLTQGGVSRLLSQEVDFTVPTTEVDPVTGLIVVTPNVPLAYVTDHSDPTDGYGTGTLYFFPAFSSTLAASDEIDVTYTYSKSIVGNYSGSGNGSQGPYFLRNTRQIVPGSETVQVWDQGSSVITTYTRNASFDATAGATGYSINYNTNTPLIAFNNPLPPTKNFQVIYQYVPTTTSNIGNISQQAFGFDGSFKIGNAFKFDSSFARSDTDQVSTSTTTTESFFGGGTKSYSLHAPGDLVDGTEKITVNSQVLNRDIDYFISYTAPGQFNFYNITPTAQDAITVQYNYQSISGIAAETKTKSDVAYHFGAETRLFNDALTLNGTTKHIGFDFSPLGGTPIGLGSNYEEYNVNFLPAFQSFYSNYSYKFNQNPLGASRQVYLRSWDHSLSTGINPGGLAKIDLGFRNFTSLDDAAAGGLHGTDSLQQEFSGSLTPSDWKRGVFTLSQKYDLHKTASKNNVIASMSSQTIDYYHLNEALKFTDRVSMSYDFQSNEPITKGSEETETAHSKALDNAYNLNLDLTAGFLKKWTAQASFLNHIDRQTLPTVSTSETKNETYHTEITPFDMLTGTLDHNRQERTSYIIGASNPLTETTNGTARLSPFTWLSGSFNGSKSQTVAETGAPSSGRTLGYSLDYNPITLSALKLATHFSASDQRQTAPLGLETVTTKTYSFSQGYTLNLSPIPVLPLIFGYTQEDYTNKNNSLISPVTTETTNKTVTASTSFTPPPVPQLNLSADYTKKTTQDNLAGISRPKTLVNAKASYQVFSWGSLIYERSDENNQGEVQAGSIADLDYRKLTQNYTLSITIPANNPVLSNFVVNFSLKQVDYKNNKNIAGTDDFKATLISFDATLNF